jgi:hypothetical protein
MIFLVQYNNLEDDSKNDSFHDSSAIVGIFNNITFRQDESV